MKKIHLIYTIVILIAILFVAKLAHLQLFTDKYVLNAYNTSIKKEIIHPNRGEILDRNGKLLVSTDFTYSLDLKLNHNHLSFDTLAFCKLVNLNIKQFRQTIDSIQQLPRKYKPKTIKIQDNLSREDYAYLQEQLYLFPALEITKKPQRNYHVNTAGNILGYINEADPTYIKSDSTYYDPGDIVGVAGVERSYEKELRGVKGVRYVLKDIGQRTIGRYKNGQNDIQLQTGKAIKLTIDYDLQKYAETLLQNKRGAVAAIDPKTGEILVLASAPTINPNHFLVNSLRNQLLRDTIQKPMVDRAAKGSYPPGSTFKMINGLAALQMGAITDSTGFSCNYGFRYGGRKLGCHDAGVFSIRRAIQSSCNSFFCKTYVNALQQDSTNIAASLDEWGRIVKSFGIGNYLNNDLATGSPGLIPDSDYYNRFFGNNWNAYTFISNGIGQGEIQATPLQMANYTAAIANQGYFYTPHIVKEINKEPIQLPNFIKPKKTLVDKRHFAPVIEGMKRVITGGTARKIRTKHFTQAGKTGTSQVPHGAQDHSLFVLFAPVEDPKIAIAVVVENGHYGATWAAPIASLVAEKYITDTIKRKYLERRMIAGNLNYQYKRNLVNYLKRKGWYVEPEKKDSVETDSLAKRN